MVKIALITQKWPKLISFFIFSVSYTLLVQFSLQKAHDSIRKAIAGISGISPLRISHLHVSALVVINYKKVSITIFITALDGPGRFRGHWRLVCDVRPAQFVPWPRPGQAKNLCSFQSKAATLNLHQWGLPQSCTAHFAARYTTEITIE